MVNNPKAVGKSILVVVAEMGHNSQREIAGIAEYAKTAGWTVNVVESHYFGGNPDFAKWIDFWRPDGLVVDPMFAHAALAEKSSAALPLVVWDAAAATDLPSGCARAMNDPDAVADAAARELLATGLPRFAFVPSLDNPIWSRERGTAFTRAIAAFGRPVASFTPAPGEASDARRFRTELSSFLAAQTMPCGVFAANDVTASLVRNECAALGLRIPQDVALVGVDDSDSYCERGEPTLTSVRLDIEQGGRATADLLATLMKDAGSRRRSLAVAPVALYGVERVVRRASTRVLRVFDGRVSRALEWIRHNACSSIGAADVVGVMGCSRRMADLSFRRATGHTILDEIHARRLEKVKSLLKRDDIPIEEIPTHCGYDHGPFLGILFKRTFGCSMRQWRQEQLR
jgi:LacI family transcriptional regulator